MRSFTAFIGVIGLALGFAACGGSLSPNDGGAGAAGSAGTMGTAGTTGSAGTTGAGGSAPCSAMNGCECLAASDRCTARSEACWCPTECFPGGAIDCVCGGGRFLGCEDRQVAAACAAALASVQTKCAGQPFVQYIGALCSAATNPDCVAACLTQLNEMGSCTEIDCGFCPVCDCLQPATPSTFASCLAACNPPPPGI